MEMMCDVRSMSGGGLWRLLEADFKEADLQSYKTESEPNTRLLLFPDQLHWMEPYSEWYSSPFFGPILWFTRVFYLSVIIAWVLLQVLCVWRDLWRVYVMLVNEWKWAAGEFFIKRVSVATPDNDKQRRVPLPLEHEAPVEDLCPHAGMPSMRQSYTVTVPEEPPAAAFPFLKQEMRRKGSMSGSVLVSTFVGLLINQAKVRGGKTSQAPLSSRENYSRFVLRCSYLWAHKTCLMTVWNMLCNNSRLGTLSGYRSSLISHILLGWDSCVEVQTLVCCTCHSV